MRSPITGAGPCAQATTRARFKIRQDWIDQAQARRDLSLCERLIAGRLATHQNLHTGRCNPGIRTLADEAGICERSAFRAIVGLERKGLIAVSRDPSRAGRNHPNGYRLLPANADRVTAFEGLTPEPETLTAETGNADSVSAELLEQPPTEVITSVGGEERESASRGSPAFGAAAPDGAAPEEDQERSPSPAKTSPPSEPDSREGLAEQGPCRLPSETSRQSPSKPNLPKEGFGELLPIWVRPWADGPDDSAAAKRAYAAAAAEVGGDVILAGARATVAACDAPRYLKPLVKWLLARGWEKKPPPPRRQSAPRQQTYHRKPKPDLARMMLALGEREG